MQIQKCRRPGDKANTHPLFWMCYLSMPQTITLFQAVQKHSFSCRKWFLSALQSILFHIASYQKFPYTVIHTGILFLTARHQNLYSNLLNISVRKNLVSFVRVMGQYYCVQVNCLCAAQWTKLLSILPQWNISLDIDLTLLGRYWLFTVQCSCVEVQDWKICNELLIVIVALCDVFTVSWHPQSSSGHIQVCSCLGRCN